jgi:hypothetical protein
LAKNGLGYSLGNSFAYASGHPAIKWCFENSSTCKLVNWTFVNLVHNANICRPEYLSTQIFVDPNIRQPKYSSTQIFVNPNICRPIYLSTQIFVNPNICQPEYSSTAAGSITSTISPYLCNLCIMSGVGSSPNACGGLSGGDNICTRGLSFT